MYMLLDLIYTRKYFKMLFIIPHNPRYFDRSKNNWNNGKSYGAGYRLVIPVEYCSFWRGNKIDKMADYDNSSSKINDASYVKPSNA